MNKEITKIIDKKNSSKKKNKEFKKWWNKNSYKIFRVILFPIWLVILLKEKYENRENQKTVWNEKKADEILSYYIPCRSDWNNETKTFYFFDNGYGWNFSSAKKYLKRKDRRFWKMHCGFCGSELRKYLINNFELDGFTKEIGNCSEGWTEIIFTLK